MRISTKAAYLAASLGVLFTACKDATPSQPAAAQKPAAAVAPATRPAQIPQPTRTQREPGVPAKLVIEPTKLDLVKSGLKEMKIDGDGIVTISGTPKLKITTDGKILRPTGELVASLDEDGTVDFANSDSTEVIQIDPNGAVQIDGQEAMRIDEDGAVWMRGGDGKLVNDGLAVFEGPPSTRRAIALLLLTATHSVKRAPPPPPVTR